MPNARTFFLTEGAMKGFRKFMLAVTAALPLISAVLIAAAWLRVNHMAPPGWFVPHLVLTDALPLGVNFNRHPLERELYPRLLELHVAYKPAK